MKAIYLTLFLLTVNFSAFSQATDTCDYVTQNNYIGGLDCAMTSLAPFTADSYQWVNCDDQFATIPGDTTDFYSGLYTSINVALIVNYLGCIDTSECNYVCTWGLEELIANKVELKKVVDLMGRDTENVPNKLLIYLYSDGTTEKVFKLE